MQSSPKYMTELREEKLKLAPQDAAMREEKECGDALTAAYADALAAARPLAAIVDCPERCHHSCARTSNVKPEERMDFWERHQRRDQFREPHPRHLVASADAFWAAFGGDPAAAPAADPATDV